MPITNQSEANEVLTLSLFTPGHHGWGLPFLLWGLPGVGKTKMIGDFCTDHGLPVFVMSPGEMGEAAFGVVPVPEGSGANMTIRFPPPGDIVDRFNGRRGTIFVDELTTAPKAAKPGMLSLLLEKRLGGYYFGDGVRVIGAANPPDIAAAGLDLTVPEANRLVHMNWRMQDVNSWTMYMLGSLVGASRPAPVDPASIEAMVLESWNDVFPQWVAKVSGFMQRPDNLRLFHKLPEKGQDRTRAWASPRSWDVAARMLAGAQIHQTNEELRDEVLSGTVGSEAAAAFLLFARDKELPDAIEVLTGKVQWSPIAKRPDITYAVCQGMAAHIVGRHKTAKTKDEVADVSENVRKFCNLTMGWKSVREITAITGKTLIEGGISIAEKGPEARKWLTDHNAVLAAARGVANSR
jgi:hypothetical protein